MGFASEDRLHSALWSFHAAVQRRDGIEARLRNGDPAIDLQDRSLTAAEAVVEARIALYRLLMTDGWIPPPSVAQDVESDGNLLHQFSD
jgi:hypothetical protein